MERRGFHRLAKYEFHNNIIVSWNFDCCKIVARILYRKNIKRVFKYFFICQNIDKLETTRKI